MRSRLRTYVSLHRPVSRLVQPLFRQSLMLLVFAGVSVLVFESVARAQSVQVQVSNLTHAGIAPNFIAGDGFTLQISGPANQPVTVEQYTNGVLGGPYSFGSTNAAGTLTLSGTESSAYIGSYTQIWSVGGVSAAPISFVVTASPVVKFTNLTHPAISPDFEPGDSFRIDVAGPPKQTVGEVQSFDGTTQPFWPFGSTDATGNFSVSGVQPPTGTAGTYTQVWSVGGATATPAITFTVGQPGGAGTVTASELGETTDGLVHGMSTLSIANGTVNTYSVTELYGSAEAYYDAGAVATLFDNGNQIAQAQAWGSPYAYEAGGSLAPVSATAWDDYTLQTDHYVIAFLIYGGYYYNPFGYAEGSCDDEGDCTIGSGGGAIYIVAATIYLGSTVADQTYVPQNGGVASLDEQFVDSSSIPEPMHSIALSWDKAIAAAAALIFVANGEYASQNVYNPLPYFVELVGDTQSVPPSPNHALRTRTYVLKDSYGLVWSDSNPVKVWENQVFVSGNLSLMTPSPNNPSNPATGAYWSPQKPGEWDGDGRFSDDYSMASNPSASGTVLFLQSYFASGFNAPGFPLANTGGALSIPGVTGMTGGSWSSVLSGPVIPLMIKSKDLSNLPKCKFYGFQGVYLTASYVGINGDTGPENPPGCN